MKDYKNKTLGDTISTIGSMLLFLLFAGCLLLIIATAAGTYTRISSGFNKTFGPTAALRYISNKVKSSSDAVIAENGKALVLENNGFTDIIYFSGGALYEKTVSSSTEPTPKDGNKIFDLAGLNISEQGSLMKITVTSNNEQTTAYVRRG